MKSDKKQYTIAYFFMIEHPTGAERFIKFLLKSLRTQDPTAPEGNQPHLVDGQPNTVAFLERVDQAQLVGLHSQIAAVMVSTFAAFGLFNDQTGGVGKLGATIYVVEDEDPKRQAALFVETNNGEGDALVFAYQVDVAVGTKLTPDTVTYVPSGKDAVNAVLAFFGELENATGNPIH